MSILLFDGLPGSGKSYGVVKNVVVPCLKAGRTIVTNIPLNADVLGADIGSGSIVTMTDDNMDKIMGDDDMHALYPGAVWIFDEVWRWWPAGLATNRLPANHAEFFRMHRHSVGDDGKTSEIVLITQDISDLAKCVRVLVETNYHSVKMTAAGSKNRCRIDINTMNSGDKGATVRQIFDKYEAPFTGYYQSHTKIQADSDITQGSEVSVDDRGNIWKRPIVRIAIFGLVVVLPIALYTGVVSFQGFFDNGDHQAAAVQHDPAPAPVRSEAKPSTPQPAQTVNVEAAKAVIDTDMAESSDYWRYAGYIDTGRGKKYLLVGNDRRVRQVPESDCEQQSGTHQHLCIVDGRPVTEWTGSRVTVSAGLMGANPG